MVNKLYARARLDLARERVRLLELLPGAGPEVIECKFRCFSLLDCPPYVALSYTWGVPKIYKEILVDNIQFPIRRNLWWFLYYMRIHNKCHVFWIDALCIDQSNTRERNHQVQLMGQIYTGATSVAVWLGEADKSALSDLAMDFVERKGSAPLQAKGDGFKPPWTRPQAKAVLALCERNYWRRVWIVQEIMHAKDLTVYCGSKSFPWQNVDQIFGKLKIIADKCRIEHHQYAAAVLASPASVIVKAKSTWDGQPLPLKSLLTTYRDLESTDIRDKVFGLLSLASNSLSVVVDYSLSPMSIFLDVFKRVCSSDCSENRDEMIRFAKILRGALRVYFTEDMIEWELSRDDPIRNANSSGEGYVKIATSTRVPRQEHPLTLSSMVNLASTYRKQGRWKEAEELDIQVMETFKRVLGQEHLETLTSMSNLALTYSNQGRWKEAEELSVQVIETFKRVLGQEHPSTLTSMANLASTYRKQGRWKEAKELDTQVMETFKRVLGQEHPDTLTSMGNLALTYSNQGKWKEAEELSVQVIEMFKRVSGQEHPDTLTTMVNLASIYRKQGRWKEAEELNIQVIETFKRVLGQEHPDTLTSMSNLALIYSNQGQWKKAEELDVQVMETRQRMFGAEHPSTLTSMNNLAFTLKGQGKHDKAISLIKECFQLREQVLGPRHPYTISSLSILNEWRLERLNISI